MSPLAKRELRDFHMREKKRWLMRPPWYVRLARWVDGYVMRFEAWVDGR